MTAYAEIKTKLLASILDHVPFDGWSEASFKAACAGADIELALARAVCPRGAIDLAIHYHVQGDEEMVRRMRDGALPDKYRDKVAAAVRFRLEAITDKEAVRRGTTLFALPIYAADGAKLIWGTADTIWTTLGDTSDDINWYTKRATLSGVYSSTVLYWLGDDSLDGQATWDFLDRRIDDVMRIEKVKSQVRENKVLSRMLAGPNWLLGQIKAPTRMPNVDLPGSWTAPRD